VLVISRLFRRLGQRTADVAGAVVVLAGLATVVSLDDENNGAHDELHGNKEASEIHLARENNQRNKLSSVWLGVPSFGVNSDGLGKGTTHDDEGESHGANASGSHLQGTTNRGVRRGIECLLRGLPDPLPPAALVNSTRYNALLRGVLGNLHICARRLARGIQWGTAAEHRFTPRPSNPCAMPTEVEPDDETVAAGQHHRLLPNTTTTNPRFHHHR